MGILNINRNNKYGVPHTNGTDQRYKNRMLTLVWESGTVVDIVWLFSPPFVGIRLIPVKKLWLLWQFSKPFFSSLKHGLFKTNLWTCTLNWNEREDYNKIPVDISYYFQFTLKTTRTVIRMNTAITEAMIISIWKAGSSITIGALCSSISRAKLVRWLHSHSVLLIFDSSTLHPELDQAEDSKSQNTQVGLVMPSSLKCFKETLTGAEEGSWICFPLTKLAEITRLFRICFGLVFRWKERLFIFLSPFERISSSCLKEKKTALTSLSLAFLSSASSGRKMLSSIVP